MASSLPTSSLPTVEPMVFDPESYAGAQIRLVAVDMDGTLLDDEKNFPPGLNELLDRLEEGGVVFVPASGRQVWTLIDSQDGKAQEIEAAQWDGGLVVCGKKSAYIERSDEPFLHAILPYYARTQVVEDLLEVLDEIERGELDDAIIKLALRSAGDVKPLAERTLGTFKQSHQFALSGDNWADLQMRGVDKGKAVSELQKYLGVSPAQTAVFGDAGNDLGMMSHAEFSFAMANASPDILAAARFVAPSNNEAGVVRVLSSFLE